MAIDNGLTIGNRCNNNSETPVPRRFEIKILILVSGFPPNKLGGIEIATFNLAKHLVQLDHEVHVMTSSSSDLPAEYMERGILIHRVKVIARPLFGFLSYLVNTLRIVRKISPDLIHVQSLRLALPAFIVKLLLKKPYIVYGHGSDVYYPSWHARLSYRLILEYADVVVTVTNDMREAIKKFCERAVLVIPNGIDLEAYPTNSQEESRIYLKLNQDDEIILFAGNLRPIKGVDYLIRAMDIVKTKRPKVRLIILGSGLERQRLEKLSNVLGLSQSITFTGQVPNEAVHKYMAAADLLVLPSLSEGLPVTIAEAMISGLPIVATKVRGISEIIRDGANGLLAQARNSMDLAEKIVTLLENPDLRKRIALHNRQEAQKYSWDLIAKQIENMYQHVVNCI